MFRGHTSEWKSVSRRRARNSACNLTVFEGKYHCKYMNNNAFAQVRRPFFRSPRPTKTRRCELASARTLSPPPESAAEAADGGAHASSGGTSPRSPPGGPKATGGSPVSDAATRGVGGSGARESLSPPPGSAAEAADGGAYASSGGTSPRSPPGGGETPRGLPKATGGSPVSNATTRGVGGSGARESLSPPPESAAEAADGGAPASSGGTSPRSPQGGGETPRGRPKATGGSPVSDATTRGVSRSGARESLSPPPGSAAEAADGGAHASSGGTSPRYPPGEGETPRDLPAHNPRNRRVGCRGGSKSPRAPALASGAAVAPPRPPTIGGASGQSVAKPRRGGADIRPREWPDAPPKRAVQAWPWATVRSRREKTAPPPCPRADGRCGVNESMWTSGKNLT